ncbi:hypothetical protein ADT27_13455 [Xanthomonas oryzae]|nr:hypothetical protein ADT27_13455 [Xanthomonas oryzae]
MTLQEDLVKSAELLLEMGFDKEASAVSAAVGKVNKAWMAEELLAEEASANAQLRDMVQHLRSALNQASSKSQDLGSKQIACTAFDDGVAAAMGTGSVANGLAPGAVAVCTGPRGSAKVLAKNGVAVASSDGATAQATSSAGGTAVATGKDSAAFANGAAGVAIASGFNGEVSGSVGAALFLVERSGSGKIMHSWSGIVGRDGVLPYTSYRLRDGVLQGEIFD